MLIPRGISEFTLFGDAYTGTDHVLLQFAKREFQLLNRQMAVSVDKILEELRINEIHFIHRPLSFS